MYHIRWILDIHTLIHTIWCVGTCAFPGNSLYTLFTLPQLLFTLKRGDRSPLRSGTRIGHVFCTTQQYTGTCSGNFARGTLSVHGLYVCVSTMHKIGNNISQGKEPKSWVSICTAACTRVTYGYRGKSQPACTAPPGLVCSGTHVLKTLHTLATLKRAPRLLSGKKSKAPPNAADDAATDRSGEDGSSQNRHAKHQLDAQEWPTLGGPPQHEVEIARSSKLLLNIGQES